MVNNFTHLPCTVSYVMQVVDQDGDSWPALDSGVLSVTAKILLWLWDLERTASAGSRSDSSEDGSNSPSGQKEKAPLILLVTGNNHYVPLMNTLKQRG